MGTRPSVSSSQGLSHLLTVLPLYGDVHPVPDLDVEVRGLVCGAGAGGGRHGRGGRGHGRPGRAHHQARAARGRVLGRVELVVMLQGI